jgi:hypothetical protein
MIGPANDAADNPNIKAPNANEIIRFMITSIYKK